MNLLSRFKETLLLAVICLPGLAMADAESFDRAVNEYLKGFRACSDANVLRLSNLVEANKKFTYYQQQLDLAVSIDESILTSTDRDMDKNLAYCQRVEDNLKRAEATPILQHAFTYCEAARSAFEAGQIQEARQQFEEYRRYQEDAYAITPTLDEVFVLASQVRSCGRFEEKLVEKEKQLAAQKDVLDQAVSLYQEATLECESTLAYVKRPGFGVNELNTANKMLKAALDKKARADKLEAGFEYASRHPADEQAIRLAELQETSRVCEGQVAEGIRAVEKQKRDYQSLISRDNRRLKQSLDTCEEAQSAVSRNNLDLATEHYESSANLKKQATGNNTVGLVKTFPQWSESRGYNELLEETRRCHEQASNAIKQLQAAQAAAAKQTEEQPPEPEEKPEQAAPEKTAKPASEKPQDRRGDGLLPAQQDVSDWNEEDSFLDDDLEEEPEEDRGAGKSWTDLIP
ncbi:MAG: hypothetical protein R3208_05740 [Ketobacteraceae bacterium]|nr:hypothetical protein [Ketobacteraceae bacterium]